MGPYSLHIGPAFVRTLRAFGSDDRQAVRRLLNLIQLDPSIDGVHKILLARDAPFTTYVDPRFYVFYYVDSSTIFVVDVERVS